MDRTTITMINLMTTIQKYDDDILNYLVDYVNGGRVK